MKTYRHLPFYGKKTFSRRAASILEAVSIKVLGGLLATGLLGGVLIFPPRPTHFPDPVYDFSKNPPSRAKIELGRALFYDPALSRDGTISCASCHSPYHAFAHTDHQLSHGIDDSVGTRNAPPLFNLAWHQQFMWDGAIHHLDMQSLAPLTHPGEMDENLDQVLNRLQGGSRYPKLFFQAFGDSTLSGENFLKALALFEASLVSATSKYDSVKWGQAQFTIQEAKGYALFQQHCNQCHTEPLFISDQYASHGLPLDPDLMDLGRMSITGSPNDRLQFKVPSLRNLSYTYPYMHDGRFARLQEVIDHFSNQVLSPQAPENQGSPHPGLSSREKTDLVAFILTLDDPAFVFDTSHHFPRYLLLSP